MITQEFLNKLKEFDPTDLNTNLQAAKIDLVNEGSKRKLIF
jgi:hypothetical protein